MAVFVIARPAPTWHVFRCRSLLGSAAVELTSPPLLFPFYRFLSPRSFPSVPCKSIHCGPPDLQGVP